MVFILQATRNLTDIWLAKWVSDQEKPPTPPTQMLQSNHSDSFFVHYLTVYCSIAASNSIFSLIRAFLFAYGGICAAMTVHSKLIGVIIRAKSYFFDSTPVGRILNRFSSDMYTVDDSLPFILNIFLANCAMIIGPVIVCAYAVPWIALVLVPLTLIYFDIQKRYRPASRDLKRMASVSLSPIYAHFSETLNGLQTIRAMRCSSRFVRENENLLEDNQKAQYAGIAAAQWLEMRLQLIGCAVVSGIAGIAILEHHFSTINPGYVGLAISYALGITAKLSGLISSFTETEKQLVAVERCYQYIKEVSTEKEDKEDEQPLTDWPSSGTICFEDVSLRYRDHLPLALNGLSFDIKPSEKIGIVGRTGAGKSSIFQCLFRMVNASSGKILVDGQDISKVSLKKLRQSLSIIPQEPFLFCGTVRENLDPLGSFNDVELIRSLEKVHLSTQVESIGGLDATVNEKGINFSVGQRQLFCLARAILSNVRVSNFEFKVNFKCN